MAYLFESEPDVTLKGPENWPSWNKMGYPFLGMAGIVAIVAFVYIKVRQAESALIGFGGEEYIRAQAKEVIQKSNIIDAQRMSKILLITPADRSDKRFCALTITPGIDSGNIKHEMNTEPDVQFLDSSPNVSRGPKNGQLKGVGRTVKIGKWEYFRNNFFVQGDSDDVREIKKRNRLPLDNALAYLKKMGITKKGFRIVTLTTMQKSISYNNKTPPQDDFKFLSLSPGRIFETRSFGCDDVSSELKMALFKRPPKNPNRFHGYTLIVRMSGEVKPAIQIKFDSGGPPVLFNKKNDNYFVNDPWFKPDGTQKKRGEHFDSVKAGYGIRVNPIPIADYGWLKKPPSMVPALGQ